MTRGHRDRFANKGVVLQEASAKCVCSFGPESIYARQADQAQLNEYWRVFSMSLKLNIWAHALAENFSNNMNDLQVFIIPYSTRVLAKSDVS
jgi:hypothetical protein